MQIKKIVPGVVLAGLLLTASCSPSGPSSSSQTDPEELMNGYRAIYDGKAKTKYEAIVGPGRYSASSGYIANSEQGYNGWSYMAPDDLGQPSLLPFADQAFRSGTNFFLDGVLTLHEEGTLIRRFSAPITQSQVTLSGTLRVDHPLSGGTMVTLTVEKNGEQVYPIGDPLSIASDDTVGRYFSFVCPLVAGDLLDFKVSGRNAVFFHPVVDYTNQLDETLYDIPSWGYYGDLHQYYYNDQVNLFHLRNFPNNVWQWYLLQSKDMFRYHEASVYDTSFVQNHYMAYEHSNDVNDYQTYPGGARDMTTFWDAEIQRYRSIGLSYKTRSGNIDCDLSMRISSDATGLVWNEPAFPLRTFPTTADGEPECAFMRKIGDRWYLCTGVSGQSVHGVGGLSYWFGDAGKGIDEIDWLHAPTHHLDGEDLAVPQIEAVKDKWYLFGWMPQKYHAAYWGGFRNLPREVFARPNGVLGTRIDPLATVLLNKGTLVTFNEQTSGVAYGTATISGGQIAMGEGVGRVSIPGTFGSTFITYDLDMGSAKEAGLQMTYAGKTYRIVLYKENGKIYLRVVSPDDPNHVLNSYVEYLDPKDETFSVKVIVEPGYVGGFDHMNQGAIIEFALNDEVVLSARTAMGGQYGLSVYADGQATFRDVKVNRLAQLYDIYE